MEDIIKYNWKKLFISNMSKSLATKLEAQMHRAEWGCLVEEQTLNTGKVSNIASRDTEINIFR
jgi:hypothetical protein